MKLKFAAWMLIMSGVFGLILTLFFAYVLTMPHKVSIMMSVMAIMPLGIGFYVLIRKDMGFMDGPHLFCYPGCVG